MSTRTRSTSYKTASVKVSRIVRTCDFCNKTINKGDKYGSTKAGFIYCEKCK